MGLVSLALNQRSPFSSMWLGFLGMQQISPQAEAYTVLIFVRFVESFFAIVLLPDLRRPKKRFDADFP